MNKQTLIKLSDTHYIVVDDSEIKEGDWCLSIKDRLGLLTDSFMKNLSPFKSTSNLGIVDFAKKITHSTQLELLGTGWMQSVLPLTLSEVEEATNGYNVEKLAEKEYREYPNNPTDKPEWTYNKDVNCHRKRKAYIKGFNAHKELVKDKLFTIKQAEKIFIAGGKLARNIENPSFEEIIQSLLPKTEWDVEITTEGKIVLL